MMDVFQKGEFKKAYKRLHETQLDAVNDAIETVMGNPEIGEQKKGDLVKFRVFKLPVLDPLYLFGYAYDETQNTLTLHAFGPHQNFYRDLKK